MAKTKHLLTIDHNYQSGIPMNASKLIAGVEMVRRLLEEQVPCKQIGACAIAFPPEKKNRVFSAINTMSTTLSFQSLKFGFARVESLDDEFESWCYQDLMTEPRTYGQDVDDIDSEDFFEMTLEKG